MFEGGWSVQELHLSLATQKVEREREIERILDLLDLIEFAPASRMYIYIRADRGTQDKAFYSDHRTQELGVE